VAQMDAPSKLFLNLRMNKGQSKINNSLSAQLQVNHLMSLLTYSTWVCCRFFFRPL